MNEPNAEAGIPDHADIVLTAYTVTLAFLQDDDAGAQELLHHLDRNELHATCAGMAGYLRGLPRALVTPEAYAEYVAELRREATARAAGLR